MTIADPLSVRGAPNLPAGFAGTFTSRFVATEDTEDTGAPEALVAALSGFLTPGRS
ncbi:hypothetical protein Aab01nite_77070 [Paractinoplanes abujensis]|uniref:Uncharacterized protein n=1 Tax=Paractinoplanes abujensis TaxID=882441 RepID=A0A7W7CT01_9ACTN|nr:hypothetical protein [Actinoplanes abujensis]MBB4692406.1 hypothetical protein [Actinoplanes abujensis]GID24117.1 hypothetical protein Aab01nite_77070 [Actinoplanes abujensis]